MTNARFARRIFTARQLMEFLDEAHYNAKFGTSNPNLKSNRGDEETRGGVFCLRASIWQLKKLSRKTLLPEVTVAADAFAGPDPLPEQWIRLAELFESIDPWARSATFPRSPTFFFFFAQSDRGRGEQPHPEGRACGSQASA